MHAPYWGQLPAPKARRKSEDDDLPDRRQSLDYSAPRAQPRSNRTSVQTTATDTHTDSTFSPFVSPITSSFPGGGLAPRPPSLPYGQNKYYPPELLEKRQRRTGRPHQGSPLDATTTSPPPPPAAPDVPRGPPLSYKYGNGGLTYTYDANGQPGPPLSARRSPQTGFVGMDAEAFYTDATPPADRLNRAPVLDRSLHNFDESGGRDMGRSGSTRQPVNGDRLEKAGIDPSSHKAEGPVNVQPQRKVWANDRSPLQRLEMTLDSLTKEEKRARVEAAERRARERAAQREQREHAPDRDKLQPPPERQAGAQVRFRDRRQSVDQGEARRVIADDPIQAQPSAATRGSLSQNSSMEGERYAPSDPSTESPMSIAKNRNIAAHEKVDLPQRNLSFRERAAKNDITPTKDAAETSSPMSAVTTPGGGLALYRSASNKLKKNPPGDPWYSARTEAEERSAALNRRKVQPEEPDELPSTVGAASMMSRSTGGTIKKKPPPEIYDRPPSRGKEIDRYEEYDDTPSRRKGSFAAAIGLGRANSMGSSRPPPPQDNYREPVRAATFTDYDEYNGQPNRNRGFAAAIGLDRSSSFGASHPPPQFSGEPQPPQPPKNVVKSVKFPDRKHEAQTFEADVYSDESSEDHGFRMHRNSFKPGHGMYQPPTYLDEWKTGGVATLPSVLLDISEEPAPVADKNTPWWEGGSSRRSSMSMPTPNIETFDGENDDAERPTKFTPPLYLKCGPLLRYCGIRHERPITRPDRNGLPAEREIWRGSVMIVTQDSESTYDTPPTLRLFVQPIELLPPPPAEIRDGQPLPPEYVDPIAGIPKLGRRGETLYVRPIEHLEEGKDVSMLEPDDGLFEITRSAPYFDNAPDPPGSFASRKRRTAIDGEKVGKYKDVRGFRLHAERGHTFWRFNIEVELGDKQQRIAYRINRGPTTGFFIPARGQSMNLMFHSCNGFSLSVNPDDLSGPDPMWRDVLNNHQTRPFHVMIGGGDQVYNDGVMRQTRHFQEWLQIKNPLHKSNTPFTPQMQDEMEQYYLERYMTWFSQGLFSLANSQIPMVNMYDDHDIIDGFGSYPHHFMKSPVFSGLGNVAFKYYMLFQHQSLPGETEESEPSWVLGTKPGPYINELSRSLFLHLGSRVALLAVDCRTERTRDEVLTDDTWKKLMDRCYDEIAKGKTQHLLVLLGVPIAYPRLVWLENILTSRLMDPIKALGKAGLLGNFLNHFDGGVEVLDDLDDHWTAKNHKDERRLVIEDLQDLAADRSVRVTILSGDVHLAAIGQFYSNPKQNLAKHKDFRYMPNIISSAIANTPPPDLMADILNKRNKVHHFDKETDEDMIPIFANGVDGKPRNNKRLLPHRNWCSIREYVPGYTPPPTPPPEEFEQSPEGTPPGSRGGLFRRFSLSKNRGPAVRPDVPPESNDRSRPPLSGGLFRSFSRRGSTSSGIEKPPKLSKPKRTLSLTRGDSFRPRNLFRRSTERPDDGGINGNWGGDSEEAVPQQQHHQYHHPAPAPSSPPRRARFAPYNDPRDYGGNNVTTTTTMGLRGGSGTDVLENEFSPGDDSYFTARAPRRPAPHPTAATALRDYTPSPDSEDAYSASAVTAPHPPRTAPPTIPEPQRRPFHRTPTGLSARQLQRGGGEARFAVDLEGGLDVCLNVEVNPRDPAGITVPYRLLVPRLWYEYQGEDGTGDESGEGDREGGRGDEEGEVEDLDEEEEEEIYEDRPKRGVGAGLKRLFSRRGGRGREKREFEVSDEE
ncbi:hypothetical protein F5B20DRAFT_38364 [Whalleya microplaca]|nr:hypothetical protein F5B20DRAFT_38364 [Whalleya microplaca]